MIKNIFVGKEIFGVRLYNLNDLLSNFFSQLLKKHSKKCYLGLNYRTVSADKYFSRIFMRLKLRQDLSMHDRMFSVQLNFILYFIISAEF